jgi:lysophospholipid acyltransferase (LPLAT)-like uncharacterized protein
LKRKFKKFAQVHIIPFFLQLFVRFIYFTNKKNFHYPNSMDNESFILAFWHGDLLMQPHNYRAFKKHGTFKAIISEHTDGEAIKKVVSWLGVGAISGSSTRGGAKALIGAIKAIKDGTDVGITPDGPKGPRYSIADGIVMLAHKTDAKILCFSTQASKYWQLNSWDKFIIPKPFGTIDFYVSEPINIEGLSKDEAKEKIKSNMRYLDE